MTIDEAIEILELELPEYLSNPATDLMHAIKLSHEALKRLENWRSGKVLNPDFMLPGETE